MSHDGFDWYRLSEHVREKSPPENALGLEEEQRRREQPYFPQRYDEKDADRRFLSIAGGRGKRTGRGSDAEDHGQTQHREKADAGRKTVSSGEGPETVHDGTGRGRRAERL